MKQSEKSYHDTLKWLETEPLLKNLKDDALEPMVWYRRKLDGCCNARDSENWMYLKKGMSNNLIIFFIGGGLAYTPDMAKRSGSIRDFFAQWQEPAFYTEECHPNNEYYYFHILGNRGIFSLQEENPFCDWNIAMFNYGTADMHIGCGDFLYTDNQSGELLLHHHGYTNFLAGMDIVCKLFAHPEKLLITGCSAGGFAAPALAAEIVERFSSCNNITICTDGAALEIPEWGKITRYIWQAPEHIAKGVVSNNFVVDMFRAAQSRIGDRAKYLFMCGYPDGVLATFQSYIDSGTFSLTERAEKRMETILKQQILQMKSLTYPVYCFLHDFRLNGMIQHCTLDAPTFSVGVPSPKAWLWGAINGNCTDFGLERICL